MSVCRFGLIILLLIPVISYSQVSKDFKVKFKGGLAGTHAQFDQQRGELTFFILSKKGIQSHRIDRELNELNNALHKRPVEKHRKYSKYLGFSKNNDTTYFFFTNPKELDLSFSIVDASTQKIFDDEITAIDISKERILKSFVHKDLMNLLTIEENSSILKLYTFNTPKDYEIERFDFTRKTKKAIYPMLSSVDISSSPLSSQRPLAIVRPDNFFPNNLYMVTHITKFYKYDSKIFLTFENAVATELLSIDLTDLSFNFESYQRHQIDGKGTISSNSYLKENFLFQVGANSENINISISDIAGGEVKKNYLINNEEPVGIANTPLLFSNNGSVSSLKDTKSFFRKSSGEAIGISVSSIENNYTMTIGSYGSFSGYVPGPIGMGDYTSSIKFAYFTSFIDGSDLTHIKGRIPMGLSNKIIKYENSLNTSTTHRFVVEDGSYYFHGCFMINRKNSFKISKLAL